MINTSLCIQARPTSVADLKYVLDCRGLKVSWRNTFANTSYYLVTVTSNAGATLIKSSKTENSTIYFHMEGMDRTTNYSIEVRACNPSGMSDPTTILDVTLNEGELQLFLM